VGVSAPDNLRTSHGHGQTFALCWLPLAFLGSHLAMIVREFPKFPHRIPNKAAASPRSLRIAPIRVSQGPTPNILESKEKR
jgi:hypothetical protein